MPNKIKQTCFDEAGIDCLCGACDITQQQKFQNVPRKKICFYSPQMRIPVKYECVEAETSKNTVALIVARESTGA